MNNVKVFEKCAWLYCVLMLAIYICRKAYRREGMGKGMGQLFWSIIINHMG